MQIKYDFELEKYVVVCKMYYGYEIVVCVGDYDKCMRYVKTHLDLDISKGFINLVELLSVTEIVRERIFCKEFKDECYSELTNFKEFDKYVVVNQKFLGEYLYLDLSRIKE